MYTHIEGTVMADHIQEYAFDADAFVAESGLAGTPPARPPVGRLVEANELPRPMRVEVERPCPQDNQHHWLLRSLVFVLCHW